MKYENQFLDLVRNLNVYRRGERRAPHQPLLLLVAISKFLHGQRDISFEEVRSELLPLLNVYAPQVQHRHQPELPYWHLQNKGLWEVPGSEDLPLQAGGFPVMETLRETSGRLTADFASALETNAKLLRKVVMILLEEHFTDTLQEDILEAVGLDLAQLDSDVDAPGVQRERQSRDPNFRKNVLRAYEHRCAVTGFRAALAGQYFGCEAAHVQWHAFEGPDAVQNGFAVEPTLHKLFDAGAWTLTDDRRILVSAELTGAEDTVNRVRDLHGRPLRQPIPGEPEVSVEYIRWHRDPNLGGVFRHPALPV